MYDINPNIADSVKALTALNVANLEKVADIQIQYLEELTAAGIASLKKASQVKDLEGAKTYFTNQATAYRAIGENAVARTKEVGELARTYPTEVKAIFDKAVAA